MGIKIIIEKKEKEEKEKEKEEKEKIRVEKKEKEKFEHYTDLKYELLKVWNREITKVYIIPIVIGALGTVTKNVAKYLEKIDFKPGLDPLQKGSLLGTARIMRKVLDYNK